MIEQLLERYRHGRGDYNAEYLPKFDALKSTQSPIAVMISCSDTRLEPSRLFGLSRGEVFSIRNVANLVPSYSSVENPCETAAGLQFAVTKLQVPHIVVLGHSNCMGIRAMMELPESCSGDNFIDQWVRQAKPARQHQLANSDCLDGPEAQSKACEQASIRLSLCRLLSYPWIRTRVESNQLVLHGWYYNFSEGQLSCLEPDSQCFNPIT